ncbi:MAG: hypothetical protein ACTSXF_14595 [Promethearchaeota archaeon]
MRKSKYKYFIFILLVNLFALNMISIGHVKADIIYYGVQVNVFTGSQKVPTLNLTIDHIYDTNTSSNLNESYPNISDFFIIYSLDTHEPVDHGNMNRTGEKYHAIYPLSKVPNGDYYVGFNFSSSQPNGGQNSTDFNQKYKIHVEHTLYIQYVVTPTEDNNINIAVTYVGSTYEYDPEVTASNVKIAKYHILKNGISILSGNLTYQSPGKFVANDVSLKNRGSGNFSVWVEFETTFMENKIVDTKDEASIVGHYYTRSAPFEDLFWITLIIIGAAFVIIIGLIIYAKRSSASITKTKPRKEKDTVEVIDIKRANVKKLDIHKQKEEKGKTKASEDLIFSVPQWTEEDLEATQTSAASEGEGEVTSEQEISYSLHCNKCNSWYEVEEFVEIDCPKCGAPLNLAMYCPNDDTWFDVPKPGNYNCPKCGKPLKYSKE